MFRRISAPVANPPQQQPGPAKSTPTVQQSNLAFLRTANQHYVVAIPSAGSGTTQNIVAATTLLWDIPTANGGYLEELLFKVAATVNPATGTAATYAANAAVPWSLFDRIIIEVNGTQI